MLHQLPCGNATAALQQRSRRSRSGKMARRLQSTSDVTVAIPAEQAGSSDKMPLLGVGSPAAATRSIQTQVLSAINESTKWTVSAAVFGVLVWQHNEFAAWAVIGAVLSSFICKVLKHVINQQRPDNAQKSDPGMPSSHANSLNFLSVYAALSMDYHTRSHPAAVAAAISTVMLGVFLTWLRVHLGYHTWPQVLVGAVLGGSTAAAWFTLGTVAAIPALHHSSWGIPVLYTVTIAAMAAFAIRNVLSWVEDRKQRQQRQQQQQTELSELQQKLEQWQPEQQQAQQQEELVVLTVAAAAT
eukprot:GHUV01010690.1.p1 GENE.GHUV01010690.1~~GHUV01010690.1.p1  ORF type:complete len:299 (+),score=103.24 GHUV01010690.1:436-1332(+)